ncbi:cyclase family protein [Pseudarthrobacter sulfonivorans]|uniref:cyclase family protein n=1 Tax=Pseudarthrobacter sulfonivorans TaxID=121292 RepID=UPI00277E5CB3|nr:cyclase family protein [Pseudarthrobacter sulfonivorans]MDQ0000604.1 kynurenine formamidase [Pseudarthrobacter sulfonivorans]
MNHQEELPSYSDLLARTDAPPGSSWGLFGDDDDLGTLNFLTPERRIRGASLVSSGQAYSLDLPLDAFRQPLISHRGALQHTVFGLNEFHRDDKIDNLFPQATSQIDGLRHFGHPDYGFYNGADPERLIAGDPTLGIHRYAEHGVAGRGVLLDVGRYLEHSGDPIDYTQARSIPARVLDETARHQGVNIEPGDILLLRFGWLGHRMNQMRQDAQTGKDTLSDTPLVSVGLEQSHDTAEWFWDHRVALAAADNVALEVWPATASGLSVRADTQGALPPSSHTGMLHRILIPLLGLAIGELWQLDELAEACHADRRYECMLVATPLRLPGGVGSPSNAVAIR